MTKQEALYSFWNGFGLKAYEETTVPTGAKAPEFPYITYSVSTDSIGNDVGLSASLWYYSKSWKAPAEKADEIAAAIGRSGRSIRFEGGTLWIRRGSPFSQNMSDDSSDMVRRVYLNVIAEFISNN